MPRDLEGFYSKRGDNHLVGANALMSLLLSGIYGKSVTQSYKR